LHWPPRSVRCRQMSALSAQITEVSQPPVAVRPPVARSQRRCERRAEQLVARRIRRRWAILSCVILACSFGFAVGILDMLH
jgi:hypothetical protein